KVRARTAPPRAPQAGPGRQVLPPAPGARSAWSRRSWGQPCTPRLQTGWTPPGSFLDAPCRGPPPRAAPGRRPADVQGVPRWRGQPGGPWPVPGGAGVRDRTMSELLPPTNGRTPEARLLVVDDEPNVVELLATSLRFAGF